MLALRPSLLVILSGGSSYRIGASGSFVFLVFFVGASGHHRGTLLFKNFTSSYYILIKEYHVVPESGSFSAAAEAASSDFLPLFMFELGLTANTPRTRTASTRSNADAAGRWEEKSPSKTNNTGSQRVFNRIIIELTFPGSV